MRQENQVTNENLHMCSQKVRTHGGRTLHGEECNLYGGLVFVFIFECTQLGDFPIIRAGLKPESVPAINAPLQLGRAFFLHDTTSWASPFRLCFLSDMKKNTRVSPAYSQIQPNVDDANFVIILIIEIDLHHCISILPRIASQHPAT